MPRCAILTSFQQPDRWILVDRRLYIRQGNFPKRSLPGRRHSRRKELSMDLNKLKPTTKQRRES
jgi:hypothetical protein